MADNLLINFLENMPLASFMTRRSPISNKEAQTLYDIWERGETDEYGKHTIDNNVDPFHITSLTSKGYVRNIPSRYGQAQPSQLEFTEKGKEVIKKIILHKEISAFSKSSKKVDYEAICRAAALKSINDTAHKVASQKMRPSNWLLRLALRPYTEEHGYQHERTVPNPDEIAWELPQFAKTWRWIAQTDKGEQVIWAKNAYEATKKAHKQGYQVHRIEPAPPPDFVYGEE